MIDPVPEIEVISINVPAVELYKRCQLSYVSTGMGAQCVGVSSVEVRAAAENARVDLTPQLSDDVQFMGNCAANYLNTRKPEASSGSGGAGKNKAPPGPSSHNRNT